MAINAYMNFLVAEAQTLYESVGKLDVGNLKAGMFQDWGKATEFFKTEDKLKQIWIMFKDRLDNWIFWGAIAYTGSNQRFTFMACALLTLYIGPSSSTVNAGLALLSSLDDKWDHLLWHTKLFSGLGVILLNYTLLPLISTVAQKCFSAATGVAAGLLLYNALKKHIISQQQKTETQPTPQDVKDVNE